MWTQGGLMEYACPCGTDHLYNCTRSQSKVLLRCVAIQPKLRKLFENPILIRPACLLQAVHTDVCTYTWEGNAVRRSSWRLSAQLLQFPSHLP